MTVNDVLPLTAGDPTLNGTPTPNGAGRVTSTVYRDDADRERAAKLREDWQNPPRPIVGRVEFAGGAMVSSLRPAYELIEYAFTRALAMVCQEGAEKYGVGNWQKGNEAFAVERLRHLNEHLQMWMSGDRSEPHLAKAAFGLMVTMWFDARHPEWFRFERPETPSREPEV